MANRRKSDEKGGTMPIWERTAEFGDSLAIQDENASWTYRDLREQAAAMARVLLDGEDDLREQRIGFLLPAGSDYVTTQWGIWRAGGVAVPMSLAATDEELVYTASDAQIRCLVGNSQTADRADALAARAGLRVVRADQMDTNSGDEELLPEIDGSRRAMMLYTSGTTSKPKGVVTTHACIEAQIQSLVDAWRWTAEDRIPLFLPLHHIHGIINIMSCALWSGARMEPFARFEMDRVLDRVAADAYTLFMAVPTIYVKLIQAIEAMDAQHRREVVEGFGRMRLMVSGSAALPASVHERWTELTGKKLLERYGMTEIGMALSNPYEGERRPGAVGQPLPGVEIRLRAENGEWVDAEDAPGEIHVRGPNVFLEYWNRPEATRDAFRDGWFQTGDMAVLEKGYYRIMGRTSVDIIKSGGYKLSALEIEAVLLEHPGIRECAVVGVPDATWGESVAAAVCADASLTLESLQDWCRERVSSYKLPRKLLVVQHLPRNAMGKVTKPAVKQLFENP